MKGFHHPPRLPRLLLRRCLPEWDRPYLSGDFDEIYNSIRSEKGRAAADLWYWGQLVQSLPSILFHPITWSLIMFNNYLKIALRQFKRHKGYSFINVAGLSVGMACFILIMLFVSYEMSYDRNHENAERIFQINVEQPRPGGAFVASSSPVPLAPALHEELPGIEQFTRLVNAGRSRFEYGNRKFYETGMVLADPGIFEMFTFPLLAGNRETVLNEKYSAVLAENIAVKYFGTESPIGKVLLLDNQYSLRVTGVMETPPRNSTVRPEIIVSFKTLEELAPPSYFTNWISQQIVSFILLRENTTIPDMEAKIQGVLAKHSHEGDRRILKLDQLSRMHLHSPESGSGDIGIVYVFLGIGILILLTACINFMNLATARSANRSKEVGLRKVVGAARRQLIRQFIGESMLYSMLSLLLALVLVALAVPLLNGLTGQEVQFAHLGQSVLLLSLLAVVLVCGLVSGSYPALFLSGFHPASVLKGGRSGGSSGSLFRKILVVAQFSISILLIICTFVLNRQLNFIRHKPLGFKKDRMLVLRNISDITGDQFEPLRTELLRNPRITGVTSSAMLPSSIGRYNNVTWEGAAEDENIELIHNSVDYDFIDTYEIELVEGRGFSRDYPGDIRGSGDDAAAGGVILNQEAVRRFGWDSGVGKRVIQTYGERRINFMVVGVVKDFHFTSLHNVIRPMNLFLHPEDSRYISVKLQTQDIPAAVKFVSETWDRFNPEFPCEYFFLDTVFEQRYQSETKLQRLFGYFSGLAIFIACLGLLGLASFAAEQRTKEIGIRKILGAPSSGIVVLLSREFARWVLAANIIAWPLAYLAMRRWLENFAYRIDLNAALWLFPLAGILAMLISWLTVGYQAFKAARTDPIESLRYE